MKVIYIVMGLLLSSSWVHAEISEDITVIQTEWAKANYQLKEQQQKMAFKALIANADMLVEENRDSAEAYIWRGIIKSTFAGIKGGLGALSYAKQAKADFEKALTIDDTALAGSAYASLGMLYLKVPGWPFGFGDDEKAKALLDKALLLNPKGIDSHYFYAEYLKDASMYDEAREHYLAAQQAPVRPERPIADAGRQGEIEMALQSIAGKHSR